MNRNSALSISTTPATQTSSESVLRAIAFTISGCQFALPISSVLQVSQRPPLLGESTGAIGLVMYENQAILLLNLQVKLAQQQLPAVSGGAALVPPTGAEPGPYLILTQTQRGELCGLPIDELPVMLELPRAAIQPIPKSYRRAHLHGLARFVALWQPEPEAEKSAVYLLDVEQAIRYLS